MLAALAYNSMLNSLGTSLTYLRIGNFTGSFTSYDTQACTFGTAVAGVNDITAATYSGGGSVVFNLTTGEVVNRIEVWAGDPAAGGANWGYVTIATETFVTAGTYTLTALTITLTTAA
jgi:hypothetical protein